MAKLPEQTSVHHVHLRVADLESEVNFYRNLGFKVINQGREFAQLSASGQKPALLLLSMEKDMRPRLPFAPGLFHVAYLLPSRVELARTLKHLGESGVTISGVADHLVSEAVYLTDPEGNGIELYSDRARTEWSVRGGMVEMATLRLDIKHLLNDAENTNSWNGLHPETRIGHIHLQVSDLEKAERFYHGLLGFDITQRSYPGALFVSAGGYHHHIGLNIWNSKGASPAPENSAGLASFGITVPDGKALKSVIDRLGSENMAVETTGASFFVRDHDGIRIELSDRFSPEAKSTIH